MAVTPRYVDAMRPVEKPLAWLGADRVLLDDVTWLGLHRWVIARKDDCPDQLSILEQAYKRAGGADVKWWTIWIDRYCYLWIVWKEVQS